MRRRFRRFPAMAAVAALTMLGTAGTVVPASAANADTLVIMGSGTVLGGLIVPPDPELYTMSGTATALGTDSGSYSCTFQAFGLAETVLEGFGTSLPGAFGCGPIQLSLCVYVRVYNTMPFACAESGGQARVAAGDFELIYDQTTPPLTSYKLIGSLTYAAAP